MLTINTKRIDNPARPFIIAEASGNHGGHLDQAHQLVEAAAAAGADAIKFQTFVPEEICIDMPLPFGVDPASDAWLTSLHVTRMRELFAKGGLPRSWHHEVAQHAADIGLAFLSTPFSVDAARFLVEDVGVQALKVASGDLTFTPLLAYAADTRLPVILSTGCAILPEIEDAMSLLDWDYTVLLHCITAYPHGAAQANLRAMVTLREHFGLPVGYSDHTLSYTTVPAVAATLGCCVYEKHLRLEDDAPYTPDTAHSLAPPQFAALVQTIRDVQAALGAGDRATLNPLEAHEVLWTRRSPKDWLRPTEDARRGRWE